MLRDMRCPELPINLFVDNKGAIDLTKNPIHHNRTKHIDIRFHFIRSKVESGVVIISHIPSGDNIAVHFIKPTSKFNIGKFGLG